MSYLSSTISHLYRIENLKTGEYYIGKHNGITQKKTQSNKLYWGSGDRIKRQIRKYGVENFKYEVLVIAEEDYIYDLEKRYVTVDLIESDEKCLNLRVGGEGFTEHTKEAKEKLSKSLKEVYSKSENRKKVSDGVKKYFAKNPEVVARIAEKNKGKKVSEETRKKLSESKIGEKNSFYGKKHTAETIEKIKEKCRSIPPVYGYKHTDEAKDKLRNARAKQVFPDDHYEKLGKVMSQLIWITDGTKNKRVQPDVLEQYLNTRWTKGRTYKNLGE